ncbi:MAG: hypothetical protein WAW03_13755 [Anaerolineae bacterium]|uniref:hypothetical protein n=1 Tax=Candidatus Amarolinea dominans TaxID=3140696 RepID=UPI0031356C2E|nr:hypothetical protein [Anaerolineae bacterium]MBK9093465.1 hypothetical protein [Anaerolineae bacterium]MBK9230574.1 hypothetical protein [Anaerolineae bacterium]
MVAPSIYSISMWQTERDRVNKSNRRDLPRSLFNVSFHPLYLRREIRDLFVLFLIILAAGLGPLNNVPALAFAGLAGLSYVVVRWYYFAHRVGLRSASRYLLSIYVIEASVLTLLWTLAQTLRHIVTLTFWADINLMGGLLLLGMVLLLAGEAVLGRCFGLLTASEAAGVPHMETALNHMSHTDRWLLRTPPAADQELAG